MQGSSAVALANATERGPAAHVWSRDVGRALRTGERLGVRYAAVTP